MRRSVFQQVLGLIRAHVGFSGKMPGAVFELISAMMTGIALISMVLPLSGSMGVCSGGVTFEAIQAAVPSAISSCPSVEVTASTTPRMPASIDRNLLTISQPSKYFGGGQFVPAAVRVEDPRTVERPLDMATYIPMDLKPTQDVEGSRKTDVFNRIADQSATAIVNSPEFRASALGQTATQVEKTVKKEVVIGGGNSIQHRFNFQLQAFQSVAKVEYKGFADMQLAFKIRESTVNFEIAEPVSATQKVKLKHSAGPIEQVSQVMFDVSF